jgi:hypothetical protein
LPDTEDYLFCHIYFTPFIFTGFILKDGKNKKLWVHPQASFFGSVKVST